MRNKSYRFSLSRKYNSRFSRDSSWTDITVAGLAGGKTTIKNSAARRAREGVVPTRAATGLARGAGALTRTNSTSRKNRWADKRSSWNALKVRCSRCNRFSSMCRARLRENRPGPKPEWKQEDMVRTTGTSRHLGATTTLGKRSTQ